MPSFATLLMIGAAAASLHGAPAAHPILAHMSHGAEGTTPGIRIWTSNDNDVMRRGDRMRVFYRTEHDAYVTIFRVDTDGRIHILFPRTPDEENYGYGGATYTVSSAGNGTAFYVDDYDGVGYLFGVASSAPFNYDGLFDDGRWDLHLISDGRVHGDPLSSLEDLAQRMLPEGFADYDTHLLPYYVEQRYSYPRFVCYDCHAYVPYTSWDPYLAWCRRYTLVVWNDPYYYYPSYWYPTRYYGGTRVVYASPGRGSRYVFKTRDNAAPGIDYRDRRGVGRGSPSAPDGRGVRGTDIGGTGSIPAPTGGGRRYAPPLTPTGGGEIAQGALGDGRRRVPGGGLTETPPPAVPVDGGRRRVDAPQGSEPRPSPITIPADVNRRRETPGVEIVPRSTEPESRPEKPRPPEPETKALPQPMVKPQPDNRPQPESRPGTESRPQPEYRPQPQPQPESRPRAPEPESRPQTESRPQPEARPQPAPSPPRPEARPQPAPRPETRPAPAPRSTQGRSNGGSNSGMVRRRP